MSLQYLSKANGLLIVQVLIFGIGSFSAHAAALAPSVETFVEQALPVEAPPQHVFQSGPVAPGSLTLEDVLNARPRVVPKAPSLPSTSSLMMSEGLRAAFEGVGTSGTPPSATQTSKGALALPQVQPPTNKPAGASSEAAPAEAKTLPTPLASSCSQDVVKWEKNCESAGYPESFVGKVSGETRTNCADGSLSDVWVANTCAPPGQEATAQQQLVKINDAPAKAEEASAIKAETEPVAQKAEPVSQKKEEPGFFGDIFSYLFGPSSSTRETEKTSTAEAPVVPVPPMEALNAANELCGVAAEMMAYDAPGRNLCRVGVAGVVNGNGPWTWTCTSNEGQVSSCKTLSLASESETSASSGTMGFMQPPGIKKSSDQKLACGAAAGRSSQAIPTADLCQGGKAGAVRGQDPWTWSCSKGKKKVSCATTPVSAKLIDGVCGTANGKPAKAAPSKKLCRKGKSGSVSGDGPWTWTCSGSNGGNEASCSAPVVTPDETAKPNAVEPAIPELPETVTQEPAPVVTPETSQATAPDVPKAKKQSFFDLLMPKKSSEPAATEAPKAATPEIPQPAPSEIVKPVKSKVSKTAPSMPETYNEKPVSFPKPEKSFGKTPTPEAPDVTGDTAPESPPSPSEDASSSVPAPAVRNSLPTAPALIEEPDESVRAAATLLTLDPSISTVSFARSSGSIDRIAQATLDKLVAALKQNPEGRISLFGYADGEGTTTRAAKQLSLTRALAVRDYLSSNAVPESRVDVHAEGADSSSGYTDRVNVKVNN